MGESGRALCALRVALVWVGPLGPHECEGYWCSRPSRSVICCGSLAYSELVPDLHLPSWPQPPALPLAIVFTSQLRPRLLAS